MTASEENYPVVVRKIRKDRRKWERLYRSLGWEGADAQTYGTFYKSDAQVILLFGSKTCVINLRIVNTLGGFQHRVAHILEGIKPQRVTMGRR